MTRRRDSSSLKIARSRNSRQTYSAPMTRGRRPRFLAADGRDRLGIVLGAAAVARCHRGDRHLAAGFPQQDQRAGALKFHVVRMSMQGQHANRWWHRFSSMRLSVPPLSLRDVIFRPALGQDLRDAMGPLHGPRPVPLERAGLGMIAAPGSPPLQRSETLRGPAQMLAAAEPR